MNATETDEMPETDEEQGGVPTVGDLLSDPQVRERFEQTSAALEAADLIRRMRRQALSASGVRGINQDELAARTGLSQPRISQIERARGRDGVSYAVLRKIAYACGIDWGQMVREAIDSAASSQQAEARPAYTTTRQPLAILAPTGQPVRTEDGYQFGRVVGTPSHGYATVDHGTGTTVCPIEMLRYDPATNSFVLQEAAEPKFGLFGRGVTGSAAGATKWAEWARTKEGSSG